MRSYATRLSIHVVSTVVTAYTVDPFRKYFREMQSTRSDEHRLEAIRDDVIWHLIRIVFTIVISYVTASF